MATGPVGRRSEVRGQRSEVRGQRSEVRSQKSEIRGRFKLPIYGDSCEGGLFIRKPSGVAAKKRTARPNLLNRHPPKARDTGLQVLFF